MKKIIIITICMLILIGLAYGGLYVYSELNKNLVCTKTYTYQNIQIKETIKAKFKKTKVEEIIGEFEMVFKDQKEANAYYINYKDKHNLLIKGNTINYSTDETKTFQKIERNRYSLKKNLESDDLKYYCN